MPLACRPVEPAARSSAVTRSISLAAVIACAVAISSCGAGAGQMPCGPEIDKAPGVAWECRFSEDFDGSALDLTRWQPMTTAALGFTQSARECYVNDPEHIRVADGLLTLTATELTAPRPCGPTASSYESGMVFSKDRFAQTYGRFEVRAKLPPGHGYQPALWMYPEEKAYGDRSGEIDIAESFGMPDIISPHVHMHEAGGVDRSQGAYCKVEGPSRDFHTYTVEWLPAGAGGFTFLYDGVPCMRLPTWDPGPPLVAPQPFDRPFFILLQLGLGYAENAPDGNTPFPGKLAIDYVRAWR